MLCGLLGLALQIAWAWGDPGAGDGCVYHLLSHYASWHWGLLSLLNSEHHPLPPQSRVRRAFWQEGTAGMHRAYFDITGRN